MNFFLNIFKENEKIELNNNTIKTLLKKINYNVIEGYFIKTLNNDLIKEYKYRIYYDIIMDRISLNEINNKNEKILLLSNEKINENYLEVGDILPFIKFKDFELVTIFNGKPILLLLINNENYEIVNENKYNKIIINKYSIDYNTINELFNFPKINNKYILLSTNYKIKCIEEFNNNLEIKDVKISDNINYTPYIIVEDVLNNELIKELNNYYNKDNNLIEQNYEYKSRTHKMVNNDLEYKLDDKLSRSLFPEIYKIYGQKIVYRELYKICKYYGKEKGYFDTHRDSIENNIYRNYALVIFLSNNNEYDGGEFELPEYNIKLKPKKNSALVFPCILAHKVNKVINGERMVIISFLGNKINRFSNINKLKKNYYNNYEYFDIY